MTTNSQGDWRTVRCYLYVKIQDRNWSRGHQCSPAHIEMAITRKVTFHTEIWFHKPDTLWLTHAYVRRHSALTSGSSGRYQRDDVASAKQFLPKKQQDYKYLLHFDTSWPIGVHFGWPCLVYGRLQKQFMPSLPVPERFGRANCVTHHATGEWRMVSFGVHVCLLVYQNRHGVNWEPRRSTWSVYCIRDLYRLILYNNELMY